MTGSTALTRPLALRLSTGGALELAPKQEIGAGGEARVFAHPRDPGLVVKVYRRQSTYYQRKIGQMILAPPQLDSAAVRLTWPRELVYEHASGSFAGYVMARAEGPRIFEFYNPATRRAKAPRFHWRLLHRTARNVAAAFAALHARGYVMGDVNESNLLVAVDGAVTLVDTDGFQVPDPRGGYFRPRVGRPEFTPPELQGRDYGEADRAETHDRFGLAVMVFLTLMEGTHPFAIRLEEGFEAPPVETRIQAGMFPYPEGGQCAPPRLAPPFAALHPRLQELFIRCFVTGHQRPALRPDAREWLAALEQAEADLASCADNPQHFHASHLPACPWCRRTRLLAGRDPFPDPAARPPAAAPVSRAANPPDDDAVLSWNNAPLSWIIPLLVLLLAAVLISAWGGTAPRPAGVTDPAGWSTEDPVLSEPAPCAAGECDDAARVMVPGLRVGAISVVTGAGEPPVLIEYAGRPDYVASAVAMLERDGLCCAHATIRTVVGPDGRVIRSSTVVDRPTVVDARVDGAMRDMVGEMRFEPAEASGKQVAVVVSFPITLGTPPTPKGAR